MSSLPSLEHGNAKSLSQFLLALASQRSSLVWLRHLEVVSWEQNAATVRIKPGSQEVSGFATPERLRQLEKQIAASLGQPIQLILQAGSAGSAASASSARTSTVEQDRAEALKLPLVRQIVDTFDNVSIIDSQLEKPEQMPADETDEEIADDESQPE